MVPKNLPSVPYAGVEEYDKSVRALWLDTLSLESSALPIF